MKNKKGNIVVIALIIVIVAITASVITWLVVTKFQTPAQQAITTAPIPQTQTGNTKILNNNQNDLKNGSILMAIKNEQQVPLPANPENLVNEYRVISFDPKSGEQKQIALIKNNFFVQPFGFQSDKIFFVNPSGELTSLDIKSSNQQVIKIAGIIPSDDKYINDNSISDFIVSGSKIFYLKGICGEGLYCALGEYNTASTENRIIIDNLHKEVKLNFMTMIKLLEYDSKNNALVIIKSGGDAGIAEGSRYELNIATGKLTEKISAGGRVYCGENGEYCTPQDKIEQEKLKKVSSKSKIYCNGINIESTYEQVITSGNFQKTFENSYYIGCLK
jgi:hypothetical protein